MYFFVDMHKQNVYKANIVHMSIKKKRNMKIEQHKKEREKINVFVSGMCEKIFYDF